MAPKPADAPAAAAAVATAAADGTLLIKLHCQGGATLHAQATVLASASPVLRESLGLPLPPSGELGLQGDRAETWATALRLLDPKTHAQAPELSWETVEPVLRLADKYDSPVLRAMCVTYMTCNQTDLSLDEKLPSAKNPLIAATLLEQCCGQPELEPYTKRISGVLQTALAPPQDAPAQKVLLGKLKTLLMSPLYMKLVSPTVQAQVMATLVSVMESVMAGPTGPCCSNCGRPNTSASYSAQWRCSCGTYNNN